MKFEYGSKSQEYDASGTASATKVMLVNSDGASVPIFLPPDKIDLPNSELLELALEVIYQENFPMRAENEKFNLLGEKIAEYDKLIEKATLTIDKMETQMTKQQEQSSMAQVTLMSVIFKLYEKGMLTDEDLAETTISEVE
ncbi:DUF1366 domain-containing protein [Streptococcus equi subsp. zooepidemicus]|uniref:DUF1366 domain-containing protein n=1 Tax=Streptococcus equi TaxID=1336 RepID=UPI001E484DEE|nr:DUF1366 domain-containing protein [Streptococcus equi]MCD3414347.1 DUF1366 domain-containing protein [Streptococcus equi subsp. zooepidemicus]